MKHHSSMLLQSSRAASSLAHQQRQQDVKLLRQLQAASTAEDVFELIHARSSSVNVIHTTTALHRLASLWGLRRSGPHQRSQAFTRKDAQSRGSIVDVKGGGDLSGLLALQRYFVR